MSNRKDCDKELVQTEEEEKNDNWGLGCVMLYLLTKNEIANKVVNSFISKNQEEVKNV